MLLQVNRALLVVSLCMVLVSLFTGCSLAPAKPIQLPALAKPVDLSDDSKIKSLLLSQYHLWKGTPYEYGGNNLDGVDCSAFVQNTYRSKLGYAIPRTTKSQIKIGTKVSKNSRAVKY